MGGAWTRTRGTSNGSDSSGFRRCCADDSLCFRGVSGAFQLTQQSGANMMRRI